MRKILIIGATSAIAQATGRLFARDGDAFFLAARNEERLKSVMDDLRVCGASGVDGMILDVNDFACHEELLTRADASLAGFDTVLIAHGTLGTQSSCEKDYGMAELELRTNFLSMISLLTPIANRFEAKRSGCIAVIASVAGDRGRRSNYIYGTAKGGISLFLQGLRSRLHRSGVHVLTVKPGFVDTPMTASLEKNLLFASPQTVAKGIYRAIQKKKDVIYVPGFWRPIMWIVRMIPEKIFKRFTW